MNVDKQSKDRRYGTSPYAAVCHFDRDSRDMLTRRFAFVPPYIGRMAICHIRVVVYGPSIQKRQPLLIINDN